MTATILALLWCVAGAATHLLIVENDNGPWWMTAAFVLSWPIFLLAYFVPGMNIEVGMFYEEGDE